MSSTQGSSSSGIAPTLPFGDINLVVLTDVHSWVAGHGTNEGPNNLDVTYGDVVSFFEQLQDYCRDSSSSSNDDDCGDLWLVQNGDWIDGTGLATDGDPSALIPLLQKVPFDVLNTGNHELYGDSVIREMRKPGGFLQWWGPRHLASNIYMNDDEGSAPANSNVQNANADGNISLEPMSNRYHVLKGKRSTVLVFGFIYNLPNPSDLVVVQTVEEAVKEAWFRNALTDTCIGYDAILVMLHAGHDDPSVEILRKEIRRITQDSGMDPEGNLPIQFVAGHTHYRRYAVADSQSTVVEAGRYMDTVGWVSFPNSKTIATEKQRTHDRRRRTNTLGNFTDYNESMIPSNSTDTIETNTTDSVLNLFHHVFLDANRKTLRETLGIPSLETDAFYDGDDDVFQTPRGREVATFIQDTRDSLGLTRKIGCAPQDYALNRSMVHEDSLWRLYQDKVGPHALATAQKVETADETDELPSSSSSSVSAPVPKTAKYRALLISQDSWRYGLYGGNHLTYDDIIVVSPFNEPIYRVSVLPCIPLKELNHSMNAADQASVFYSPLPAWILSGDIDTGVLQDDYCEVYVNHFGLSRVQKGLQNLYNGTLPPNIQWDPIEYDITTTSIWLSFVKDEWPCEGSSIESGSDKDWKGSWGNWGSSTPSTPLDKTSGTRFGKDNTIAAVVAVSLVLLCTLIARFCVFRKNGRTNRSNGYDGVLRSPKRGGGGDGDYRDEAVDEDSDSIQGVDKRGEDSSGEEEPSVQIV